MTSTAESELQKMIRAFRVADLQTLLQYAGRNKVGKKSELQNRALQLVHLRSQSIEAKIREIHAYRYTPPRSFADIQDLNPLGTIHEPPPVNFANRSAHQNMYAIQNRSLPNRSNNSNNNITINRMPMPKRPHIPSSFTDMMPGKIKAPNLGSLSIDMYNQYPLSPDLKFKELPFYDVLDPLIKPTSLIVMPSERYRERDYSFCFTPQQLTLLVQNHDVQIQLRMCVLDVTAEQEDEIPPDICLKVNNRVINLPNPIPTNRPGVEPKRPKRPVDITSAIRQSDTEINIIHFSWASSTGKPYVFAVYLVQRLSSYILINRLREQGVRNPDHTTAVIKEKLCQDRDSEIATMSLRGSLMCPLGKIKMVLPVRALTCAHLQCFDGTLYLQMNEKKPKWICPVCDKAANFKDLAIDGLFLDIISKAPGECNEVQFHEDGSWTPVMPIVKKTPQISEANLNTPPKAAEVVKPKPNKSVEVIDLNSDSDTEDSWHLLGAPPHKKSHIQSDPDSPVIIESVPSTSTSSTNNYVAATKEPETQASTSSSSKPTESTLLPQTFPVNKQETVVLDDSFVDYTANAPQPEPFAIPPNLETITSTDNSSLLGFIDPTPSTASEEQGDFDFYNLIIPQQEVDPVVVDNDEIEIIELDDDEEDDI